MKKDLRHKGFLALHGLAVLAVLLLPLYMRVAGWASSIFGDCILHRFFIYCALCGGTRSVVALTHLDFVAAWNYNALVVIFAAIAIVLDVWAWVRYFQKKEPLLPLPKWSWGVAVGMLVVYFVLRNYLMIFHGIDPTGDLGFFWEAVRIAWG